MTDYQANSTGRCPHCLTGVRFEPTNPSLDPAVVSGIKQEIGILSSCCPQCGKVILTVGPSRASDAMGLRRYTLIERHVVWPLQNARPVPADVPEHIAADYREAATVLNLSAKASAALSRRCLQAVLREAGNANQRSLSDQIDAVMPHLPSHIAESIDHIRNIGNFAAHPTKDQASGQIVEVEPGEAEWNLDVLDMLFDHYYVKPEQAKRKRAELDAKLAAAGKPPMK